MNAGVFVGRAGELEPIGIIIILGQRDIVKILSARFEPVFQIEIREDLDREILRIVVQFDFLVLFDAELRSGSQLVDFQFIRLPAVGAERDSRIPVRNSEIPFDGEQQAGALSALCDVERRPIAGVLCCPGGVRRDDDVDGCVFLQLVQWNIPSRRKMESADRSVVEFGLPTSGTGQGDACGCPQKSNPDRDSEIGKVSHMKFG